MTIVDALAQIESNSKNYSSMYDHYEEMRISNRRSPFQVDEDADIYFGYWYEKDEE